MTVYRCGRAPLPRRACAPPPHAILPHNFPQLPSTPDNFSQASRNFPPRGVSRIRAESWDLLPSPGTWSALAFLLRRYVPRAQQRTRFH